MSLADSSPLGLIAGSGELPLAVANLAKKRSIPVVAVCFDGEVRERLEPAVGSIALFGLGQAGKTIAFMKDAGVKKVVMIGKIVKKIVFRDLLLDAAGVRIMMRAGLKSDTALMLSVIAELESAGLKVERQTDWLPDAMPGKGTAGKISPTGEVLLDMEFGMKICRYLAGEDVGQTIIVKDGVVVAVEAVEGTDETIDRGCTLAGKGAVMVKVGRPNQDRRFDIPAIGTETINRLARLGAAGIAFEAGGVVFTDIGKVVKAADEAGIALFGL